MSRAGHTTTNRCPDKPRNLWILNHYAVSPDLPGGTRHYDLAHGLVQRGWDVTLFASGFHYSLLKEMKLAPGQTCRTEMLEGVRFVWLRTSPYAGNDWRRVVSMLDYCWRAYAVGRRMVGTADDVPRPTVVLGSSVHLLAPLTGLWLARHFRSRFLMEVRDLWPQTLIDMGVLEENSPVSRGMRFLEKHLYERAERVIVLPPSALKYLSRLGISPAKVSWLPNGVDLSLYESMLAAEPTEEPFIVSYAGAHGETNGLELILAAAQLLKQEGVSGIRFELIGDGPEKPRLQRQAADLALDNVVFVDPVPKQKLPAELARASALLHVEKEIPDLAQYGGSPNKLRDYMAAGRPLIVSSAFVGDPIEERGCGIVIPPDRPEALKQAVLQLRRRTPKERRQMGENGRQYVGEKYDMRLLAKQLDQWLSGP